MAFLHRLDGIHLQVGPAMASTTPGRPPPEPASNRADAAGAGNAPRIEQVVGDDLGLVADRGEVVNLVPFDQKAGEGEALCWRVGGQIEAEGGDAVFGEGCSCGFGSRPRDRSPRLSHTSSRRDGRRGDAWMRLAWPMVSGLCWLRRGPDFLGQAAHLV